MLRGELTDDLKDVKFRLHMHFIMYISWWVQQINKTSWKNLSYYVGGWPCSLFIDLEDCFEVKTNFFQLVLLICWTHQEMYILKCSCNLNLTSFKSSLSSPLNIFLRNCLCKPYDSSSYQKINPIIKYFIPSWYIRANKVGSSQIMTLCGQIMIGIK